MSSMDNVQRIINSIEEHKGSSIKNRIDARLNEFEEMGKKTNEDIFSELCFCLLTANFSAEGGIRIQNSIGKGFLNLKEKELAEKLKELGHRYPSARAGYIVESRKCSETLKELLESYDNEQSLREWFVDNIKGLGFKEASHFLRNIGYKDLAIIDFHIIDLLVRQGIIDRPKTLTKRKYLEIEQVLREIARKANLDLAGLDIYLWYMETGKILK